MAFSCWHSEFLRACECCVTLEFEVMWRSHITSHKLVVGVEYKRAPEVTREAILWGRDGCGGFSRVSIRARVVQKNEDTLLGGERVGDSFDTEC